MRYFPISKWCRSIARRWRVVMLTFLLVCGGGIPTIWLLVKPLHSVAGAIRIAPVLERILTSDAEDFGGRTTYERLMYTQADIIVSSRVLERVADDLAEKNLDFFENYADYAPGLSKKLKRKLEYKRIKPEPAKILKEAIFDDSVIEVAPDRKSELIKITMESKNEEEATQIVDAFIEAYMGVVVTSFTEGQSQKLTVLENERNALANKLQSQRGAIRRLAEEYGSAYMTGRYDMKLRRVSSLLAELTKVKVQRINLESRVGLYGQAKEQVLRPEDMPKMRQDYVNNDPGALALTANIMELERELIVDQQRLAANDPELEQKTNLLKAFKVRIEELKEKAGKAFDEVMAKEIENASEQRLADTRTALEETMAYEDRLREMLSQEDKETIELGRKQLTLQGLQDEMGLTREMYDTVSRRIEELKMERKRPARISVAYNADTADIRDERANYTIRLMLVALACGMVLALIRGRTDRTVRTPADVAELVGLQLIGTTTRTRRVRRARRAEQVARDYQTIRINLGLLDDDGMPKKLAVISPGVREGRTTFAIDLAKSMARSGKSILLIDGDLRKPDIASLLGLQAPLGGLQDVLLGKEPKQAICPVPSIGLDVLAADPKAKGETFELLASSLTAQRINGIAKNYDHVVIDTPPVLVFPEALIWAKIADGVILTAFARRTTAPALEEAKKRLGEINARLLGTILSNVDV